MALSAKHGAVSAIEWPLPCLNKTLMRSWSLCIKVLLDETWQMGGFGSFTIHEPKRRKISATPFQDRVVHHALHNITRPIFERSFIDDSYANRVGKGTHRNLNRATQVAKTYKMRCSTIFSQYLSLLVPNTP